LFYYNIEAIQIEMHGPERGKNVVVNFCNYLKHLQNHQYKRSSWNSLLLLHCNADEKRGVFTAHPRRAKKAAT